MAEELNVQSLKEVARKIEDAVTLPDVAQKVGDLCGQPDSTPEQLADVIQEDPVLSAKVLKTVNSSFFGFVFKTADVKSAVVRLGLKQIRDITMATSVGHFFNSEKDYKGYSPKALWQHSIGVGIMNQLQARIGPLKQLRAIHSQALLCGLVHDIGIIFEEQHLGESFEIVLDKYAATENVDFHKVELEVFGFNHTHLGAAVLNQWKMPEDICFTVARHHEPKIPKDDLLSAVTAMSELLITHHDCGFNDVNEEDQRRFGALQMQLGLMGKYISDIRAAFDERFAEAMDVLGIE